MSDERADRVEQLKGLLRERLLGKIDAMAELLASSSEADLLGKTEFALRDLAHQAAAEAEQVALDQRAREGARRS